MLPAKVGLELELNPQGLEKYINKRLDECIQAQLWFVDVDKIVQLTSMSKRFLEDEVLSDVRMRAIERRKARKRYYSAAQAFEVITEIMDEW